jgi:hypothetical protein
MENTLKLASQSRGSMTGKAEMIVDLLDRRLRRELEALFRRHGMQDWRLDRAADHWRLSASGAARRLLPLARLLLRRRLAAWSRTLGGPLA